MRLGTSAFIVAVSLAVTISRADAQGPESDASRRPRFLLEIASARTPVDFARSPSLRRSVTLDLDGAPFRNAIAELSRQTGMAIVFSDDLIPGDSRVDIHVRGLSIAAALTELLLDKELDVVMRPDGSAALVRRTPVPVVLVGTIAGKVVDAQSGAPLAAATVAVEGTTLGATTGDDGTYRIAQAPAGVHTILARRVGYTPLRRSVTVSDNQEATADFRLTAAPMSLETIVTTATGQQRRVELGNTVAAIDVSTRTATAPLKSVGDLLNAQATGVQVLSSNTTGGAPRIRVRGLSSTSLSNDPIYIIDGIRAGQRFRLHPEAHAHAASRGLGDVHSRRSPRESAPRESSWRDPRGAQHQGVEGHLRLGSRSAHLQQRRRARRNPERVYVRPAVLCDVPHQPHLLTASRPCLSNMLSLGAARSPRRWPPRRSSAARVFSTSNASA